MSLNGFEIRLELLKLAQNTLNEKAYNSRQSLMDQYNANCEKNITCEFPKLPNMPTTEEIIAEAKKLNDFVSNG